MDIIPNDLPLISHLNDEWSAPLSIDMLRLDEVHPVISGNKWYKLKENIQAALSNNNVGILTFGGAYSNHLAATAATANSFRLKSIGIVRGLYTAEKPTETLNSCANNGMKLVHVSKEEYNKKTESEYLLDLANKYPNYLIVPEGGANEYGRKGIEDIARLIPHDYTHICVSVGTGTTFTGICNSIDDANQQVIGYAPMKGGRYIEEQIKNWTTNENRQLFDDWHFGGFGKWKDELIDFMNEFYSRNKIPLDIVYTAKMMYGIKEQILAGFFPNDAKLLVIHTGGLQGNVSIASKLIY